MNFKLDNGRWVSQSGDALTPYEFKEFVKFSDKIRLVYGNEITYDKIELSQELFHADNNKVSEMNKVLNHIKQLR